MKVEALVQIEVGQTFSSKDVLGSGGNVHLIEPRLVDAGVINYADTKRVQYSGKKILQRGDVLFVSRGRFEAAVFESDTPSVATNAFFVLRPIESIRSEFLCAFLNSQNVHQILRRTNHSTTAKFITKDELSKLELPDLSLAQQDEFIETHSLIQKTEQLLAQKSQILKNIREGLFSQIQGELV